MKKRYLFPILLTAVFVLGPRPSYEDFDGQLLKSEIPLNQLVAHVAKQEANVVNLKPDNHSEIVWADSIQKTPFSVVYLHGFSASPKEGDPIHKEFAQRYGANLYIPRLTGHGIQDDDSFKDLSPKDLIDSAKEAIAIGQLLGEQVILMSCSTGSTLALYLAGENPNAFHSLILYSPNIDLHDSKSELLTMPWGKQMTNMIMGDHHHIEQIKGTELEKYWTSTYHSQGVISLKYLIEHSMTEAVLSKVKIPYFLGYYYKNENEFDEVVSIDKMKWFHKISSTPTDKKRLQAFSDVGNHVMVCDLYSKNLDSVRKATWSFAEEVLKLTPRGAYQGHTR